MTVPIVIASAPSGLQTIVDGVGYTTPITFNWQPGSSHTLNPVTPQYFSDGHTQYVFTGAANQTITTPSSGTTYTANFTTQYLLNTASSPPGAGTVTASPSGPWYAPGTLVTLTAVPGAGEGPGGWSGVDPSSGTTATVTMNGYRNAIVSFGGTSAVKLTGMTITNGTVQLAVTGAAGRTYAVQVSTDLKTWTNRLLVVVGSSGGGHSVRNDV